MKPIKIQICPEVREFNEWIEHADFLTDHKFDTCSAEVLLAAIRKDGCYAETSCKLGEAIANLAIKR